MSGDNPSAPNPIEIISRILLWLGFAASLYFMFVTGYENKSIILIAMFACWVASPFIALLWIGRKANRPLATFNFLLMLILPVLSAIAYSGILIPGGTRPAFIFLVMPFISWLLIGISRAMVRRGR